MADGKEMPIPEKKYAVINNQCMRFESTVP